MRRRAVLEDYARRAFNLDGENVELVVGPGNEAIALCEFGLIQDAGEMSNAVRVGDDAIDTDAQIQLLIVPAVNRVRFIYA